jgi:hypothetical protein
VGKQPLGTKNKKVPLIGLKAASAIINKRRSETKE